MTNSCSARSHDWGTDPSTGRPRCQRCFLFGDYQPVPSANDTLYDLLNDPGKRAYDRISHTLFHLEPSEENASPADLAILTVAMSELVKGLTECGR